MMFAYKITNTVNGKAYIGITTNPVQTRMSEHLADARNKTATRLHRAMAKHGPEAFTIEVLAEASSWEELTALERALIAEHGTFHALGRGYNMTLGGDGCVGRIMTPETKAKTVALHLGKKRSPEACARIAAACAGRKPSAAMLAAATAANRGRPLSDECKAKIAAKATGRGHTPETKAKLKALATGRKRSREAIEKVAAFNRGRERTPAEIEAQRARNQCPEYRAKISAAMKGRKFTDEHRAKIAAGRKAYWAARHEQDLHQSDDRCLRSSQSENVGTRPHQYAWSF